MPLITGCELYVDEKPTTVSYSLEGGRRLAVPYSTTGRRSKLEIRVASLPTQVWVYDYDIAAWVLQR